jgi:hypothetical protein
LKRDFHFWETEVFYIVTATFPILFSATKATKAYIVIEVISKIPVGNVQSNGVHERVEPYENPWNQERMHF